MDRSNIPSYNEFGNDEFGDPEGENNSCLSYKHVAKSVYMHVKLLTR